MFSTTTALCDIAHVIQLAIAPVFLLNAVGALLVVLTNRLGRSVDRRRVLAATVHQLQEPFLADANEEIGLIAQRVNLIYTAIVLAVICALFVCLFVTADSNLISFGRLCRSAIDHLRHSTNTGQCAIGTGGQFGVGGDILQWHAVVPGAGVRRFPARREIQP